MNYFLLLTTVLCIAIALALPTPQEVIANVVITYQNGTRREFNYTSQANGTRQLPDIFGILSNFTQPFNFTPPKPPTIPRIFPFPQIPGLNFTLPQFGQGLSNPFNIFSG
ncbi:uncharacterized protein LOC131216817 [Anopheles bellator]|uniref:uncharacterized protein LOC131216817 n=1 Tax=Anopheles bellator TaxID=139047 RepID=UPI0026475993|nr:uncharacterized protein LOC131216817 [Anopheles bellator]